MPGELNEKEYGALLNKMDSVLGRVEDMGKKLDRVLDPEEGLYPQVSTLQTAAEQNVREHRTFWRLFRVVLIALVVILVILGPEALAWILKAL